MAYWAFRTPAEVLKTQVQTGQVPNCVEAFDTAKISNPKGTFVFVGGMYGCGFVCGKRVDKNIDIGK